jgi:propionate CoA-transferase
MSHNRIVILRDGKIPKLVESVFKVVFSGQQAIKYGQEILYVTERAVFRLTESGIILEEVAPGINVDKDITSKMGFMPIVGSIKEMDKRIFNDAKMGVRDEIVEHN